MPENALPQEEMWASKSDVESALFAGYYNLRSSITTHLIPLGELRAGCVKRRSGNSLDKLDVKPTDGTYTDWKIFLIIRIPSTNPAIIQNLMQNIYVFFVKNAK